MTGGLLARRINFIKKKEDEKRKKKKNEKGEREKERVRYTCLAKRGVSSGLGTSGSGNPDVRGIFPREYFGTQTRLSILRHARARNSPEGRGERKRDFLSSEFNRRARLLNGEFDGAQRGSDKQRTRPVDRDRVMSEGGGYPSILTTWW